MMGPTNVKLVVRLFTFCTIICVAQAGWAQGKSASPTAVLSDYFAGLNVGLVTSDKVRVRGAPSTSSAIVAALNTGILAVVHGQSQSSENMGQGKFWWYNVTLPDGTEGWIYGQFLYIFLNSTDTISPFRVKLGGRAYTLVGFEKAIDSASNEVDKMPAFVEEGAHRALPLKIDQAVAMIRNPDGWYMMKETMDEESESISGVQAVNDTTVIVTVTTRSNRGMFDLQVTCVLKEGPDRPYFEIASIDGKRDFFLVVQEAPVGLVQSEIEHGANVNARDDNGWTPLTFACSQRYDSAASVVIQTLIKAGADVNAPWTHTGDTPLMCSGGGDLGKTLALLTAGAKVNARNDDGWTALFFVAGSNYPEKIDALMKAGADLNARSKDGETALMNAARQGYPENVLALLKTGADAKLKDTNGKTAMDYAKSNTLMKGTDALRQLQMASR
jgi:hypothetical protein